ncbi:MAG: DUF3048 domain-containing protein [Oscillospiraceae bacterium]|nr:DUF3048 domain-containing protein [Oscillospiraceae bacterium]
MKKSRTLNIISAFILAMGMLGGCAGTDSSSKPVDATTSQTTTTTTQAVTTITTTTTTTNTTQAEPEEPDVPLGELNLLTGEYTLSEGAVGKRPVAVMVNNIKKALPQYGIAAADIIFECPVEGGITRLMAVYADVTKVPDVCSVRSCRYYYPILALSYDAVYAFWGKDETIAKDTLERLDVDRLDGYRNEFIFARDKERGEHFSSEHTGYYKGSLTLEAYERSRIRSDLLPEKNKPAFNFSSEDKAVSDKSCKKLCVYFSDSYYSDFIFDSKQSVYYKLHNGKEHMDSKADVQLSFTNIFVLETDTSVINQQNGLISLDWTGGDGYYASMGTVVPVKWSKADEYADLVITNVDGTLIEVNTGKSYIGFTEKIKSNFKIKE